MLVIRNNLLSVAVIDPSKKFEEEGQRVNYAGKETNLMGIILAARLAQKEIRYYYKDLITKNGEVIPAEVIVFETPPGFVQSFHSHKNIHEITVVDEGKLLVVESETLQESDLDEIKSRGTILEKGDMVIEDPEVRHTHMNPGDKYLFGTTVKVARIPLKSFSADWKR